MKKGLLTPEEVELLQYRIQEEEASSRLYNQMSLWFSNNGFKNFSALYSKYSSEEKHHADWACDFLISYGHTPQLYSLPSPQSEFNSCTQILEMTLEHELDITRQCNELATKAQKSNNHPLYSLASKYCAEQVEEINKAIDLLDHAALTTDMLILDSYVERYL